MTLDEYLRHPGLSAGSRDIIVDTSHGLLWATVAFDGGDVVDITASDFVGRRVVLTDEQRDAIAQKAAEST